MNEINKKIKVAFDCDGTILCDERVPHLVDTPNYKIIQLFKLFESLGCEMYIWTGGGMDYGYRWAEKLGLKAIHVEKGSFIPDICIDDEEVNLGKVNIKV